MRWIDGWYRHNFLYRAFVQIEWERSNSGEKTQKSRTHTCCWNWLRHRSLNWEEWLRFLSVPNSPIAVTAIGIRICQVDGASMNYSTFSYLLFIIRPFEGTRDKNMIIVDRNWWRYCSWRLGGTGKVKCWIWNCYKSAN